MSRKGNQYLKADGWVVTVYGCMGRGNAFRWHIRETDGATQLVADRSFASSDEAKLGAFEAWWGLAHGAAE